MRNETGPISTKPSFTINPDSSFFDTLATQLEKITSSQKLSAHQLETVTSAGCWEVTTALQQHPSSSLKRATSRAAHQALERARDTNLQISDKLLHHFLKQITTDRHCSTEKWPLEEQVKLLETFAWDNPSQVDPDQKAMLEATVYCMATHIYATNYDTLAKKDPNAIPSQIFKKALVSAGQLLPKPLRQAYEYKPINKNKPSWQFGKEKIAFDSREEAVVGYLLNKYKVISPKQGITVHVRISTRSRHSLDFYVPWAQTFIEYHPTNRAEAISKTHHTDTIEERTMRINKPIYQHSEVLHIWELEQLYDVLEYLNTKKPINGKPNARNVTEEKFCIDLNHAKSIFYK